MASHDSDSSGSTGNTEDSSRVSVNPKCMWHGLSVLIGPHQEPDKDNCDKDNSEVETQLPSGPLHSLRGLVRTSGRFPRAHQRPLALALLVMTATKNTWEIIELKNVVEKKTVGS